MQTKHTFLSSIVVPFNHEFLAQTDYTKVKLSIEIKHKLVLKTVCLYGVTNIINYPNQVHEWPSWLMTIVVKFFFKINMCVIVFLVV